MIPIVIGVTGYRQLKAADIPQLKQTVSQQLARLQATYPASSFIMLNSLAAGADTLCAQAAVERGITLICPLPLAAADYRTDFTPVQQKQFDALLKQAASVFVAPDTEARPSQTDRSYSYRQAGIYIAAHSHLLLALWDGSAGKKGGCGSAETVGFMLNGQPRDEQAGFTGGFQGAVMQIKTRRLSQKRFTVDFLTKELRENNGEVPQYYVEGSHEAIISPEEFDMVQDEMARRKELGRAYSDKAFHSKLICGDCGGFYGRKVWHSTDEYRTVIFQCNRKFKNEIKCTTPRLTEDEIKERFLTAYNELMGNRENVIADCELIRQTLCTTEELDAGMQQAQDEMTVVAGLMQAHIKKNASIAQSQADYAIETERIEKRYNDALERYTALESEKTKRVRKSKELKAFTKTLKQQPLVVAEWNERLWITLLDTATVNRDGKIVFRFKSGVERIG